MLGAQMPKGVRFYATQSIPCQRYRFRMAHRMMLSACVIRPNAQRQRHQQQLGHWPDALQPVVAQIQFLQVNPNDGRRRRGQRRRRRRRCTNGRGVAVVFGQQIAGEQQKLELRQSSEQVGRHDGQQIVRQIERDQRWGQHLLVAGFSRYVSDAIGAEVQPGEPMQLGKRVRLAAGQWFANGRMLRAGGGDGVRCIIVVMVIVGEQQQLSVLGGFAGHCGDADGMVERRVWLAFVVVLAAAQLADGIGGEAQHASRVRQAGPVAVQRLQEVPGGGWRHM